MLNKDELTLIIGHPLSDAREFDFVKDYVRVIYEPSPDTLELYFSVLAHHQENYTKEVSPDLSKTVVTMPNESGPDGAAEPAKNLLWTLKHLIHNE